MQSKAHASWTHEARLREVWRPQPGRYTDEELAEPLLGCGAAGPDCSHDRANVLWKVERMVSGDPDGQLGLSGLTGFTVPEVLAMIGEEAGFHPDIFADGEGPVPIDPFRVLAACRAAGDRLANAARRGEQVVLGTGHPSGLPLLYMAVAELVEEHGAMPIRPAEGFVWREQGRRRHPLHRRRQRSCPGRGQVAGEDGNGDRDGRQREARVVLAVLPGHCRRLRLML